MCIRDRSSSLLTSLTAVDLAALERTLEFLATSAEPVDITADALPGDWAGGHLSLIHISAGGMNVMQVVADQFGTTNTPDKVRCV